MSDDLAWVPDFVPAAIPVLLDAEAADIAARLDEAQAATLARRFDRVLFSREDDYARAVASLGESRCGFSPHPVAMADPLPPMRRTVERIGVFFGDDWVDAQALTWLHDAVWSRPELAVVCRTVEVVVGGEVGDGNLRRVCPDFRFVGPVDRVMPFFSAVDVVVALRRGDGHGAAAVVEALGYARPLLVMPWAVEDVRGVIGAVCRLAEDAEDFARALAWLIDDPAERRRMVDAALVVACKSLSPAVCFRPLIEAVAGVRPPPAHAGAREPGPEISVPQAFGQGLAHQRAGRLHQAEQVFRRILGLDPAHPETVHALGTLLIQKGEAAQAEPVLRRAARSGCAARSDRPQLTIFTDPGVWTVADIAAHLAVWARVLSARPGAVKAIAADPSEGYTPLECGPPDAR